MFKNLTANFNHRKFHAKIGHFRFFHPDFRSAITFRSEFSIWIFIFIWTWDQTENHASVFRIHFQHWSTMIIYQCTPKYPSPKTTVLKNGRTLKCPLSKTTAFKITLLTNDLTQKRLYWKMSGSESENHACHYCFLLYINTFDIKLLKLLKLTSSSPIWPFCGHY